MTGATEAVLCLLVVAIQLMTETEAGCPDQAILKPCKCDQRPAGSTDVTITCSQGTLPEVLSAIQEVAGEGSPVDTLRLINVPVPYLPSSFAMGTYARSVSVNYCNVTGIDPEAFNTIYKEIVKLQLMANVLTEVPRDAIHRLANLQQLYLQYNRIESLRKNDFAGLYSLLQLNLYGNKIASIASDAFHNPNLVVIDLGNNSLSSLPSPDRPDRLPSLTKLKLGENLISSLEGSRLKHLGQTLTELDLNRNKISVLPNGVLENMAKLDTLLLENNVITSMGDNAFAGTEGKSAT